jgi:hypothetical protein
MMAIQDAGGVDPLAAPVACGFESHPGHRWCEGSDEWAQGGGHRAYAAICMCFEKVGSLGS